MSPYSWSLTRPAGQFLHALPPERRIALFRDFDSLALHPFREGHLRYRDTDEREMRVWVIDELTVHYCLDHAVREVRISRLEKSENYDS